MNCWCGRPESNRHRPRGPTDFHTTTAFAASPCAFALGYVRGLDYPFTVAFAGEAFAVGAARLVSTPAPWTFVRRDWLGIAISKVPPTLSSSTFPVSRKALNFRSSPLRLPVSPRPRTVESYRL